MTTARRLRLTILGATDLTVELAPGDLDAPHEPRPEVRATPPSAAQRAAGRTTWEATVGGWVLPVVVEDAERAALRDRAAQGRGVVHSEVGPVRARLPGRVVRVWVAPGQSVVQGERLLAVEAMKMENEVHAPRAGVVARVHRAIGETVEVGDELVTLE